MLLITTGVTLYCQASVSVCLGGRHCLYAQRAKCCWERMRLARIYIYVVGAEPFVLCSRPVKIRRY